MLDPVRTKSHRQHQHAERPAGMRCHIGSPQSSKCQFLVVNTSDTRQNVCRSGSHLVEHRLTSVVRLASKIRRFVFRLKEKQKCQKDDEQKAVTKEPPAATGNDSDRFSDDEGPSNAAPIADGQASPENCPICLSRVDNKSFTDSCFHTFCFVCIREWSKQKAECPLCKQKFKSIIHNVRSLDDYDQFLVQSNPPPAAASRVRTLWESVWNSDHNYDPWMMRRHLDYERQLSLLQRPSRRPETVTARGHWRRLRQNATSDFRRSVYRQNMRLQGVRTGSGRHTRERDITPAFFRRYPASTHRLVPWLTREMNAILGQSERKEFIVGLIMDLIKRYDIQSEEFRVHIEPYLRRDTDLFINEFFHFARSPYDMVAYDSHAAYEQQPANRTSPTTTAVTDGDDEIIVVSPPEHSGEPPAPRGGSRSLGENSVVRLPSPLSSPPDFSSLFSASLSQLLAGGTSHHHPSASATSTAGWASPLWGDSPPRPTTPPPTASTTLDLTLGLPFPSVTSSSASTSTTLVGGSFPASTSTQAAVGDTGSESDIEIVGFEKPFDQRSPIQLLSSASDVEIITLGEEEAKRQKTKKRKKKRSKDEKRSKPRDAGERSSSEWKQEDCKEHTSPRRDRSSGSHKHEQQKGEERRRKGHSRSNRDLHGTHGGKHKRDDSAVSETRLLPELHRGSEHSRRVRRPCMESSCSDEHSSRTHFRSQERKRASQSRHDQFNQFSSDSESSSSAEGIPRKVRSVVTVKPPSLEETEAVSKNKDWDSAHSVEPDQKCGPSSLQAKRSHNGSKWLRKLMKKSEKQLQRQKSKNDVGNNSPDRPPIATMQKSTCSRSPSVDRSKFGTKSGASDTDSNGDDRNHRRNIIRRRSVASRRPRDESSSTSPEKISRVRVSVKSRKSRSYSSDSLRDLSDERRSSSGTLSQLNSGDQRRSPCNSRNSSSREKERRSHSRASQSSRESCRDVSRQRSSSRKRKSSTSATVRSRSRSSDCQLFISKKYRRVASSDSSSSIEFIVAKPRKHKKHRRHRKRYYVIDDSTDSEGNRGVEILDVVPAKLKVKSSGIVSEEKKFKKHHTGHKKSSKQKETGEASAQRRERVTSNDSIEVTGFHMGLTPTFESADVEAIVPDLILSSTARANAVNSPDELHRKCEVSSSLDVLESIVGGKDTLFNHFTVDGEIVAYPVHGQEQQGDPNKGNDSDKDDEAKKLPSVKDTIADIEAVVEKELARIRDATDGTDEATVTEAEQIGSLSGAGNPACESGESSTPSSRSLLGLGWLSTAEASSATDAGPRKRPSGDPVLSSLDAKSPRHSDNDKINSADEGAVCTNDQAQGDPEQVVSQSSESTGTDAGQGDPTTDEETAEEAQDGEGAKKPGRQSSEGFGLLPPSCDAHNISPSKAPVLFSSQSSQEEAGTESHEATKMETTAETVTSILKVVEEQLASRRSSQSEESSNGNNAEDDMEQKSREIAHIGWEKPRIPPPFAVAEGCINEEKKFSVGSDNESDGNDDDSREAAGSPVEPSLYEVVSAARPSPSRSASMILLASMNAQKVFNQPVPSDSDDASTISPGKGYMPPTEEHKLELEVTLDRHESLADVSDILGDLPKPGTSSQAPASTLDPGNRRLDRVMSLTTMELFEQDSETNDGASQSVVASPQVAPATVTDLLQKNIQTSNGSSTDDLQSLEKKMREEIAARLEHKDRLPPQNGSGEQQ